MLVSRMRCERVLPFYLALLKPARGTVGQAGRRRQPFQIGRFIHVEPARTEFNRQPCSLDRPDGVFQRQWAAPFNVLKHGSVRSAARDRIEAAIFRRAERHIGKGGQQLLEVRNGQGGGVGSGDEGLGVAPEVGLL